METITQVAKLCQPSVPYTGRGTQPCGVSASVRMTMSNRIPVGVTKVYPPLLRRRWCIPSQCRHSPKHQPSLDDQHRTALRNSQEALLVCRAVVEDGVETTETEQDDLPQENEEEQLEAASKP